MAILLIIVALWLINDVIDGYKAARHAQKAVYNRDLSIIDYINNRLHGCESSDYGGMHCIASLAGCDIYIHLTSTTKDACRLIKY